MAETADAATRRRYLAIYRQIERAGGEDVAQLIASLAIRLEQDHHARLERHELVALVAVLGLVRRNLTARTGQDGALQELAAEVG